MNSFSDGGRGGIVNVAQIQYVSDELRYFDWGKETREKGLDSVDVLV